MRSVISIALVVVLLAGFVQEDEGRLIDDKLHHLGNDVVKEWKETTPEPEGKSLTVEFDAKSNPREGTITLSQRDINEIWVVSINGKAIGQLKVSKPTQLIHLAVPPKTLKDGKNVLSVTSKKPHDDIVVGKIRLFDKSLRDMKRLGKIEITANVPVRVSVTDKKDRLVELYYAASSETAVRKGIFYTTGAGASLELPDGEYVLYATRGMEWSLDKQEIRVEHGKTVKAEFTLEREVDTTGFVAADTHIHTVTYSGHGDASADERMITLAGEGVELAIATDHNHHTDYRPFQEKHKLNRYFTPVIGNEVTTKNGHFNAFPFDPKAAIPPYKVTDWVKLVDGIRAKGAKVVILNHPHWPDLARGPLGVYKFDSDTGDREAEKFTFDAMELVNSTVDEPKPLTLFADWFAMLNRGERITAVGSSDSHTVWDPVGQGRTYVRSSTDDPARIDVDEACKAFLRGDVSVSLGIFADITVDGEKMGQTVRPKDEVEIEVRVASPKWVTPRKVLLFANGTKIAEKPAAAAVEFTIAKPAHDAYLVCVVLGDEVKLPGWTTLNDYTLAATNPIYLDVDGGGYQSPRETAKALLEKDSDFKGVGDAILFQAASLSGRKDLIKKAGHVHK